MTNMEIVTSPEYHDLLNTLYPRMSFEPEMIEINKMIEFFKFQSNQNDEVSYMEEHMISYEVMKNTYFFIGFPNLVLIGLYTNTIGKDYFILVERDGTINFIGDTIINWTNDERLPFEKEAVFEFQTQCHYKYNIPTITWMDKTIKMGRTITENDFNHDVAYQSYLKSDMLYDTYRYLKDNSHRGNNLKKLRSRIRGFTENKGVLVYYVNEDHKVVECILDSRFFTNINPNQMNGFIDLDIEYTYSEDNVITINHYKSSKPSLFNLTGFFYGFKERLRLYSVCFTMFRIVVKLYTMLFFFKLNRDIEKMK